MLRAQPEHSEQLYELRDRHPRRPDQRRSVPGASSRCWGMDRLAGFPGLIKMTWLPCCRSWRNASIGRLSQYSRGHGPAARMLELTRNALRYRLTQMGLEA